MNVADDVRYYIFLVYSSKLHMVTSLTDNEQSLNLFINIYNCYYVKIFVKKPWIAEF